MIFQSYALFPWLSVLENVEFGLKRKVYPARNSAPSRFTISSWWASPILPARASMNCPAYETARRHRARFRRILRSC